MARGLKQRFAEHALENGLESAVRGFPQAFSADEIAELRKLEAPLRSRLTELFEYWQKFDDALDD